MTDVPTAAKAANDAARPQSRDEAILQAMREFEPRLENGERVTHAELATHVAELGHGDPPLTVQDVYAATAAFRERQLALSADWLERAATWVERQVEEARHYLCEEDDNDTLDLIVLTVEVEQLRDGLRRIASVVREASR
jgi:hypothetical protein